MIYKKMDPEMKKRWVEALRSGKYKQGKGRLHDEVHDTYCCLGVLNEIEDLGIPGEAGALDGNTVDAFDQNVLIRMNDVMGCSFEHIADWIEANL